MNDLKPGDLISFDILAKHTTNEGLGTGSSTFIDHDQLEIFRYINLLDFPSFSDFTGQSTVVKHGNYGMIIKKIGRPYKMTRGVKKWTEYDVYEVFISNLSIRQVFRHNLKKVF